MKIFFLQKKDIAVILMALLSSSSVVERHTVNVDVAGSNPAWTVTTAAKLFFYCQICVIFDLSASRIVKAA